jgi:hypothetical protein
MQSYMESCHEYAVLEDNSSDHQIQDKRLATTTALHAVIRSIESMNILNANAPRVTLDYLCKTR